MYDTLRITYAVRCTIDAFPPYGYEGRVGAHTRIQSIDLRKTEHPPWAQVALPTTEVCLVLALLQDLRQVLLCLECHGR